MASSVKEVVILPRVQEGDGGGDQNGSDLICLRPTDDILRDDADGRQEKVGQSHNQEHHQYGAQHHQNNQRTFLARDFEVA